MPAEYLLRRGSTVAIGSMYPAFGSLIEQIWSLVERAPGWSRSWQRAATRRAACSQTLKRQLLSVSRRKR